jgi:hypothetical protein
MASALLTQLGEISSSSQTNNSAGINTQIVIGRKNVLDLHDLLLELAKKYGQDGAMDHLKYFLNLRESRIKSPT